MTELMVNNFVEHIFTPKHAYLAERFVLAIKSYFLKKLYNKDIKWYDIFDDFWNVYNNEVKQSTGFSHLDGTKDINALKSIKANIILKKFIQISLNVNTLVYQTLTCMYVDSLVNLLV